MTRVFISYRRSDTNDIVDALDHELVAVYGRGNVYRDVASIQPGTDWLDAVTRAVQSSDVLLAVIGPDWLGSQSTGDQRRIDDRRDAVRVEVATALTSKVPVLPILARGAKMPRPEEVPLDVSKATRINAIPITNETSVVSGTQVVLVEIGKIASNSMKGRLVRRAIARASKLPPITGTWVSSGGGDALLEFTFHADGTYEFAGGLRQERSSGSMVFENYHAGEYRLSKRTLSLTAFRSSTSRRDPDFPEGDYVDRPERVKDSDFRWHLRGGGTEAVLTLGDTDGRSISYTRIL